MDCTHKIILLFKRIYEDGEGEISTKWWKSRKYWTKPIGLCFLCEQEYEIQWVPTETKFYKKTDSSAESENLDQEAV